MCSLLGQNPVSPPQVIIEVFSPHGTIGTVLTTEWLLPSMNADVSLEVTGLLEGGPVAVGTRQRQALGCGLEENNQSQSAALVFSALV